MKVVIAAWSLFEDHRITISSTGCQAKWSFKASGPNFVDNDSPCTHLCKLLARISITQLVVPMKIRARWSFAISASALLICSIASSPTLAQETSTKSRSANVTIVTSGDISVTRAADGATSVSINFVPRKAKSSDTRITISGAYTLDVNGGVKEVKGAEGIELHVLSHEDLKFEAPEIAAWEQIHKFSQYSACSKIPNFAGCGYPVCDEYGHPGDQCRYNSSSGCACVAPGGSPCSGAGAPQ